MSLEKKSEAALKAYIKQTRGLVPGSGSIYEHGFADGYGLAEQESEDKGFANIQKWMAGVERKRVRKLEEMNDKQVEALRQAELHHKGMHSTIGNQIRTVLREFGNLQSKREADSPSAVTK